jgi:ClpP class serine protease
MFWLLNTDMAARYERARSAHPVPTDAQLRAYADARPNRAAALASGQPDCLAIAGDVAQITVDGLLTPQPDWLAWFLFGNTAYSEIREALAAAEMNPAVKRVEWAFSSPGGMVDGFFETIAAIESSGKPSSVRASMACSAAYGLAAMAGPIEATSPASEFGSVGIVRTYYADGPAAQELAIDVTSTAAPNKRPDVRTPEGQAVVRSELDVQHELLVDAIARGRSRSGSPTTANDVNAKFGRGGSVFAEGAKAAGMIDKVPPRTAQTSRSSKATLPSIRTDAVALAELFGAKRDDETEDQYVERFAAFATALAPTSSNLKATARAKQDAGDLMAEAMGLPPDPTLANPGQVATAAKRREYHHLIAQQLGLSPQAAAHCVFPDAPEERSIIGIELSVPAPAPAARGRDTGDALADALGLPPDPKADGDRLATAIETLVSRLDGQSSSSTAPHIEQAAPTSAAKPSARPNGKDAGDLMAEAMGLPPDPGERRAAARNVEAS